MQIQKKNETKFYDTIRIMATLLVVVGHATYATWTGDGGAIELITNNSCSEYNILAAQIGKWGGGHMDFICHCFLCYRELCIRTHEQLLLLTSCL